MEESNLVNRITPKQAFCRIGLALLVLAGAATAAQLVLMIAAQVLAKFGHNYTQKNWFIWVMSFIPLYLIAMPLCFLVMRLVPAAPKQGTKLTVKELLLFLLMCFPLMYGGNLIGSVLSMLLSSGQATNALETFVLNDSPLKIIVIVIIAPFLEEFFFRKQLIDRLGQYGEKTVIFFSGLSFGLFHMNLFQFFYAFALGTLFAYIYTRTRRLRYTVLLHMVINFIGSVLAPKVLELVDLESISAGNLQLSNLPGLLILVGYAVALIGLSIAGLVLLIIKAQTFRLEPAPEEMEPGTRFKTAYLNVGCILFAVFCLGMCVVSLLS